MERLCENATTSAPLVREIYQHRTITCGTLSSCSLMTIAIFLCYLSLNYVVLIFGKTQRSIWTLNRDIFPCFCVEKAELAIQICQTMLDTQVPTLSLHRTGQYSDLHSVFGRYLFWLHCVRFAVLLLSTQCADCVVFFAPSFSVYTNHNIISK